jgi:hypothetical protein
MALEALVGGKTSIFILTSRSYLCL